MRRTGTQQQIWVIKGTMDLTGDGPTWHLATGDCLAITLGARLTFHNPGSQPARYVLALADRSDVCRRFS